MLAVVQTFDPPGVCARNLTECLAIQLKERDRFDPAMRGAGRASRPAGQARPRRLAKLCGVERRGSRRHDRGNPQAQSEARPRLRLDDGAADRARRVRARGAGRQLAGRAQFRHAAEGAGQPDATTRRFRKRAATTTRKPISPNACRPRPGWCARSISAPRPSSKCPARSCASRTGSLSAGVQHLRPLNLKTVADAIGMHELTVSRVTANKYMATSRGIFELKYFFTSSIAAADGGEAHSAEAVRHRIRQLIERRERQGRAVGRHHRGKAARGRHRYRAPHRREISRSHAHSVLGAAPARETVGRCLRRI